MVTDKPERLFFALWPDAEWQDACHSAARSRLRNARGRWIPAPKLHITLVFLGALARDKRACVEAGADGVKVAGFALDVDHFVFRSRNKMVWALPQTIPRELITLVTRLRDVQSACGLKVERRPFVPHLTLMRNAVAVDPGPLEEVPAWPVRTFALVRSRTLPSGAVYEAVREWPLEKSPPQL